MQDPYLKSVLELLASEALDMDSPCLITVDELRAAGALDVPSGWRKSLGEEPDLFSEPLANDGAAEQKRTTAAKRSKTPLAVPST